MTFDAKSELKSLQAETKAIRKTTYRKSRLDKFKGELLLLHRKGAKPAELQRWLKSKRIKVVLSTITRWLKKNG